MTRRPILSAIAIAAAFALILFTTAWHAPDCRSPRPSITIGGTVLLARCRGRHKRGDSGPMLAVGMPLTSHMMCGRSGAMPPSTPSWP
jgi:hypothetical protein